MSPELPPPSFLAWRADVEAMPDGLAKAVAEAALSSSTYTIRLDRETIQEGKTFSRPAFDAMVRLLTSFIEARVMTRWDRTGEPPSHLEVTINVDVG